MGEHIAAHAEQLDSVTVIAHRKHVAHGLCAPPNVCCGYPPKNDDLLDQILIRLPDLQGKLRVMERTGLLFEMMTCVDIDVYDSVSARWWDDAQGL